MGSSTLISRLANVPPKMECPADGSLAVLWALAFVRDASGQDAVSAAEVAEIVTALGRRSISRQASLAALRRFAAGAEVHRRRQRKGPDLFSIMGPGDELLESGKDITLVDPGKALQQVRDLESLLGRLRGSVVICDPYLDSRTLDFLASLNGASSIRLLTERVVDREKVGRELAALAKQLMISVEVRIARKGVLHDRYIIHSGGMLILGTSLNSFGLKQSFISKAGHDVATATRTFFDMRWKEAAPL